MKIYNITPSGTKVVIPDLNITLLPGDAVEISLEDLGSPALQRAIKAKVVAVKDFGLSTIKTVPSNRITLQSIEPVLSNVRAAVLVRREV